MKRTRRGFAVIIIILYLIGWILFLVWSLRHRHPHRAEVRSQESRARAQIAELPWVLEHAGHVVRRSFRAE